MQRRLDHWDGEPPAGEPSTPAGGGTPACARARHGAWLGSSLRAGEKGATTNSSGRGPWAWLAALVREPGRRTAAPAPPRLVDAAADPWQELRAEVYRSRRHERPFVLVRLPGSGAGDPRRRRTRPRSRKPYGDRLLALGAHLREGDRAWEADGSVYLLLPGTARAVGEALLWRVRLVAPELVPAEGVRLAVFPEDGSSRAALLAKLRWQWPADARRPVTTAPERSADVDRTYSVGGLRQAGGGLDRYETRESDQCNPTR